MAKLPDTDKQKIQSCYGIVFLLDWNNLALAVEMEREGRGHRSRLDDLMGLFHF